MTDVTLSLLTVGLAVRPDDTGTTAPPNHSNEIRFLMATGSSCFACH